MMIKIRRSLALAILTTLLISSGILQVSAQRQRPPTTSAVAAETSASEMRPIIEYYIVDRGSLQRSYPVASSSARREIFRKFYGDVLERLKQLNFDAMSQAGKVDYVLFRNHL